MQWLTDFVSWLGSENARPVIYQSVVIAVAMVLSAWLAAGLARRSAQRLIAQRDFELRVGAIATLVEAAHDAAGWADLTDGEREDSRRGAARAETTVRLLPIRGSDVAAQWASLQIRRLRARALGHLPGSINPAELDEFRERLLDWQKAPGRARRWFTNQLAETDSARPESTERVTPALSTETGGAPATQTGPVGTVRLAPATEPEPAAPNVTGARRGTFVPAADSGWDPTPTGSWSIESTNTSPVFLPSVDGVGSGDEDR